MAITGNNCWGSGDGVAGDMPVGWTVDMEGWGRMEVGLGAYTLEPESPWPRRGDGRQP